MRILPLAVSLSLLAGCGDADNKPRSKNAVEVTVLELRPTVPNERQGYQPMTEAGSGSRFVVYVAPTPVATLSDFASAEIIPGAEGIRPRVKVTLSKRATDKLVKDWTSEKRWQYGVVVNDQLRGSLRIDRNFDGVVTLKAPKRIAQAITRAVNQE